MGFVEKLAKYQSYVRRLNVAAKVEVEEPAGLEPPAMPAELLAFLKAQFGSDTVTIERLEEIKKFFQEITKRSPSVHIMLAFLPTAGERAQITRWFRDNIAADILLSFSQNSNLIGGMLIRGRTRIFDLSLRTVLLANKNRVGELLK